MPFHRLLAILLLAATFLWAPPSAGAHPRPHRGEPVITDPRPLPGSLQRAGAVTVAALVATDEPLTEQRIAVDGRAVTATVQGDDHPTIVATLDDVAPGRHEVTVTAATGQGRDSRTWWFDVSAFIPQRLAGAGRVETAVAISQARFPERRAAPAALLAAADTWQLPLVSAPVAVAESAPLLLSARDELSDATAAELRRVLVADATVTLLGAELSAAVADEVRALGFRVERVAESSTPAAAAAIARRLLPAGSALVVSSEVFADALSVSAAAGSREYPVLLTAPDALPAATDAVLRDAQFDTVLVIGGTDAISDAVRDRIRDASGDGAEIVRIAGPTRYHTARAVADTFFPSYDAVAIASGERFPDALAGGPHAAEHGAPLLLVPSGAAAAPQQEQVAAHQPSSAYVSGGPAAVPGAPLTELAEAYTDAGAPAVVSLTPGEQQVVATLDEVVITLERAVDPAASVVHLTVAGHEVTGRLRTGDFPRTLVFTVIDLPTGIAAGRDHDVRLTVAAGGGGATQHVQRALTYHKPLRTLSRGDEGPQVRDLEARLVDQRYWVGPVDGVYDNLTHQAVLAFQKVNGLARDGIFGPETRAALDRRPPLPAPRSERGLVVEVDKTRQVVLVVSEGTVAHVFNSSTGTEEPYTYEGETYLADTPTGSFEIFRQIDRWRQSHLGRLWRPKYFNGGIALHGSTSVPSYPASHGCVRVSIPAMNFLWERLPVGTRVLVYGQVR